VRSQLSARWSCSPSRGLDRSQDRLHTALLRHIVLTMAALAICAATAGEADAPILSNSPDDMPPDDPGLIALTIAEIKRLFALLTQRAHGRSHHLRCQAHAQP